MTNPKSNPADRSTDTNDTIRRRRFLAATGAGAAATLLAGCGGDEGEDGDGTPEDGGGQTDTPGETTTPLDDLPSGTLNVGHLGPMDSPLGAGSLRTANMAAASINEDGGIGDAEVNIVRGNTADGPQASRGVAEDMILQQDVDVIIGTFSSEVTQGIIDLIAEHDVPFIITGSAAPSSITEFVGEDYDHYKNTFRTGPVNSFFQAEAQADYAEYLSDRHGWSSFSLVVDDAEWTNTFEAELPSLFDERGLEITDTTPLNTETTSFGSVLGNVEDSGADAMFRFFAHINGGPMMGQWAQGQYQFGIEGIHVTGMLPAYFQLTEGAAAYETTSQSAAGGVTDITEKTVPFTEAYREQFGDADNPPTQHPMYMGYNTYDAIHFYKEVVEEAGTANYDEYLDNIVDAMLSTTYTGVAGDIDLYGSDADYPHDLKETRNDDGRITNYPVTQWRSDGSLECVYPEVHRTAEHEAPAWMS